MVIEAQANGEPNPIPIGMFIDGVPFLKKFSFIAWWTFNLITGVRHVAIILRKEAMCQCGCRGWCTLHRVFDYLRWSLDSGADGIYPEYRHDGSPWHPDDPLGFQKGQRMLRRLCFM